MTEAFWPSLSFQLNNKAKTVARSFILLHAHFCCSFLVLFKGAWCPRFCFIKSVLRANLGDTQKQEHLWANFGVCGKPNEQICLWHGWQCWCVCLRNMDHMSLPSEPALKCFGNEAATGTEAGGFPADREAGCEGHWSRQKMSQWVFSWLDMRSVKQTWVLVWARMLCCIVRPHSSYARRRAAWSEIVCWDRAVVLHLGGAKTTRFNGLTMSLMCLRVKCHVLLLTGLTFSARSNLGD